MELEWLSEGVMVTILGMCVVFAVLIFICIILALMGYIMKNNGDNKKQQASVNTQVRTQTPASAVNVSSENDKELIAVITAAIAEYERALGGYVDPDKLVVRSFRRVHTWKREAIQEQQNNLY